MSNLSMKSWFSGENEHTRMTISPPSLFQHQQRATTTNYRSITWKHLLCLILISPVSSSGLPKHNIISPLHPNSNKKSLVSSSISPVSSSNNADNNNTNATENERDEDADSLLQESSKTAETVTITASRTIIKNETITSTKTRIKKKKHHKITKKRIISSISSTATSKIETIQNESLLRRLKHEWKNMIHQGVAYRWETMENIQPSSSSHQNQNATKCDGNSHSHYVRVGPFQNNLLTWHFTISGCPQSVYEHGLYHGRILLPKNYPASPPRIQMITPSGRFIPGVDICLSTASNYHPEAWTPRWTILGIIDALRLHMLTASNEIGGMDASIEERKRLAFMSNIWKVSISTKGAGNAMNILQRRRRTGHSISSGIIVDHSKMISLFFSNSQTSSGTSNNSNVQMATNATTVSKHNNQHSTNHETTAFIPHQQQHNSIKRKKHKKSKHYNKRKKQNDLLQNYNEQQLQQSQYKVIVFKISKMLSNPSLILQLLISFVFGIILFS